MHHQHILGCGRAKERKNNRIAEIAAVPVRHAVDFDGAKQQWQAGRGHYRVGRYLVAREDSHMPGLHIGRRDEELQIGIGAQCFEIDKALDQVLQRINIERIDVVGREVSRQGIDPGLYRRALERGERQQPLHDRALQCRKIAGGRCRTPEVGEPLLRLLPPAAA